MIKSTVAREDDGTVQINFNIPKKEIDAKKEESIKEAAKKLTIPGFRKGNVPIEVAKKHLDDKEVTQKALNKILPKAFADAIRDHSLRPAIYPKFEIVTDKDPWAIKAITCEIPPFELGDYKKIAKSISGTKEEKENKVINALLDSTKVIIPKILIEEEVNSRLSSLLSRLEKLGLSLESYLSSIKKTGDDLRHEYEDDSKKTIALELILARIADSQNLKVDPKKVDEAFKASGVKDENQKYIIESILRKRAVIDSLTGSI